VAAAPVSPVVRQEIVRQAPEPATEAKSAAEPARPASSPRSVVVPIRVPRDSSCEIVLRIVIADDDEKAA
jgi:hypothetical protein